jgi:multiple sugar transport system ATP-binding protein
MGSETYLHVTTGSDSFVARVDPRTAAQAGESFKLAFDLTHLHLFDPATEASLLLK